MDVSTYLCLVCIFTGGFGSIILPPHISHGEAPDCTSYSSLCHLSYRYVDDNGVPIAFLQSSSQICKCPGNDTCALEWSDMNNSYVKTVDGTGQLDMKVKISYCHLPKQDNICLFNEPVLTTRGRGPLSFEIVGDLLCKCNRPLYPHSSWSDGLYDYIEYSCGKPRCFLMGSTVCTMLTYKGATSYKKDYFCRCRSRRNEVCLGPLPNENNTITYHSCIEHTTNHHKFPSHL